MDLLGTYDSDNSHDEKAGSIKVIDESENVVWERLRPHIPGVWATHVHVPVPRSEPSVLRHLQTQLTESHRISGTLVVLKDPHLSLSKHIPVNNNSVDALISKLDEALRFLPARPVTILRNQIHVLYNDVEQSGALSVRRAFFAHPVAPTLNDLVEAVDDVMRQYQLPVYYQNPIFHVSIASMKAPCRSLPPVLTLPDPVAATAQMLDEVTIRFGHKTCVIPLLS